jgi:hypothetical protein
MSQLSEFLKEKAAQLDPNRKPQEIIEEWRSAVERLQARIRSVLAPYSDNLKIEEWVPLLDEGGIRYNAVALTISFFDYQITVLPKKAPVRGPGRVEVSCGAKVLWLIWNNGDEWSYKWEYPPPAEGPQRLTDEAIEQLVQNLLS